MPPCKAPAPLHVLPYSMHMPHFPRNTLEAARSACSCAACPVTPGCPSGRQILFFSKAVIVAFGCIMGACAIILKVGPQPSALAAASCRWSPPHRYSLRRPACICWLHQRARKASAVLEPA